MDRGDGAPGAGEASHQAVVVAEVSIIHQKVHGNAELVSTPARTKPVR